MHTKQNKLSGEMVEKYHVRKYKFQSCILVLNMRDFLRAKQQ